MVRRIPDKKLKLSDVPVVGTQWKKIEQFALSAEGYGYLGDATGKFFHESLRKFRRGALLPRKLADLRAIVFFAQRRARHTCSRPTGDELDFVLACIFKIRLLVRARDWKARSARMKRLKAIAETE